MSRYLEYRAGHSALCTCQLLLLTAVQRPACAQHVIPFTCNDVQMVG